MKYMNLLRSLGQINLILNLAGQIVLLKMFYPLCLHLKNPVSPLFTPITHFLNDPTFLKSLYLLIYISKMIIYIPMF